jgi:subtilase family serine protease
MTPICGMQGGVFRMTSTGKFRTSVEAAAIGAILAIAAAPSARAQSPQAPRLITQAINLANLTTLSGNTRPEANATNDRGVVPDSFQLNHMLLQLRRSAAQEQAVDTLIDQLHDPSSANFHKWLTTAQIAARFGLATSDIQTVTGWLAQSGFAVNVVYPGGLVIDFSGTAGQVRNAFHTEIHQLSVDGVAHIANMSDPQIPTALAPAIVGIVSLNDFRPQPAFTHGSSSNPLYSVVPADLWTIYNFTQAFNAGYTGVNQTIYLIESAIMLGMTSNPPNPQDWNAFHQTFLPQYSTPTPQAFPPMVPSGGSYNYDTNCTFPGEPGPDNEAASEATLDAEMVSAAAPLATIMMATCLDQATTSGFQIAMLNLIYGTNVPVPSIISMSDHMAETQLGQAGNYMMYAAYQHAVMIGTSIYVSAGDSGAADNDKETGNPAIYGVNVNGFASTPYNVAVGGTDFADTYLHQNSTYWNSTNPSTASTLFGSALSYIPEIPWNNSCGSQLYAGYPDATTTPPKPAFATTYGSNGACNSTWAAMAQMGDFQTARGGGGGPSACAYGTPTTPWVVSGNCVGYLRPSWQTGVAGLPRSGVGSGVRVLPDVSLFASNGPWKHTYVFCYSGDASPNVPCKPGDPTSSTWNQSGGGTSFAAPIMAGIQALINQRKGQPQGNPNYRLYQLAAQEYGPFGQCNSMKGNAIPPSCIFHDITLGDNVVPCYDWTSPPASLPAPVPNPVNCYGVSSAAPIGVLSNSNSSYAPAFPTGFGWDFATGIGSVNVYNLVMNW